MHAGDLFQQVSFTDQARADVTPRGGGFGGERVILYLAGEAKAGEDASHFIHGKADAQDTLHITRK